MLMINTNPQDKPLVDKLYTLEKQAGKGGWTYIVITEIKPDKHKYFGLVRVRGWIDDYELKSYNLMQIGNGKLFLPVKAEIRKKIGKAEGDQVHITLYADDLPMDIPEELKLCLADEPEAFRNFMSFTEGVQRQFIEWIYSSKKEDTKIERIAKTVNMALLKQTLTKN
jgi:hypothetical protein